MNVVSSTHQYGCPRAVTFRSKCARDGRSARCYLRSLRVSSGYYTRKFSPSSCASRLGAYRRKDKQRYKAEIRFGVIQKGFGRLYPFLPEKEGDANR